MAPRLFRQLPSQSLLKFLEIQRRPWQPAVERTVLASVRAFHFLRKVHFGGLPETTRPSLDHSVDDSVDVVRGVRERSPYDSDSDSSDAANSGATPWSPKRVCLPVDLTVNTTTAAEAALPYIQSANGSPPPPYSCLWCCQWRTATRGDPADKLQETH